jgi:hypothetical protein
MLALRSRLQSHDLRWVQQTELAIFHVELQRPIFHPLDLLHVVPNEVEHPPDLPVSSFVQRDLIPRVIAFT